MCFNTTTSMITFSISVVCSCLLMYTGITKKDKSDVLFSVIVILIGLMQLVEYFLWKNQNCNKVNHIFSLFIFVLLFLQGFVTTIVYYLLYPNRRFFSKSFIFYFLLFYTLLNIYVVYYVNQTTLCSKPSKTSCRLEWAPVAYLKKNNNITYIIYFTFYLSLLSILFIEMYLNHHTPPYLVRLLFLPVTFILSYLFIVFNEMNKTFKPELFLNYSYTFGTIWCFTAVFLGIVGVLHI
jgi:hypothetical protein